MSQQKKKSGSQTTASDAGKATSSSLQVKDDVSPAKDDVRKPLVSSRTSPLIRVRFRNPIRSTVCGSGGGAGGNSTADKPGRCGGRRRLSLDGMSTEKPAAEKTSSETTSTTTTTATTKDDLGLEPRTRQYEKHELLQDRSPESGLSEVEAFLLEKQRLLELGQLSSAATNACGGAGDTSPDENDDEKLVPRAPQYEPHPILQVKTEGGLTELELYFMQKEAEAANDNQDGNQQPAGEAAASS